MHRSVFCFLWTAREVQEAEQKKYISCPFCSFLCLFALLKLIDLAFVTPAWQTNKHKKNEKIQKLKVNTAGVQAICSGVNERVMYVKKDRNSRVC